MSSLWFVLIGAALGYRRPDFFRRLEEYSSRVLDVLLLCMLFFTSLAFGMDRDIAAAIGRIGLSALVTSAFTLVASAGTAIIWSRATMARSRCTTPGAAGSIGLREAPFEKEPPVGPVATSATHAQPSWILPALTASSVVAGWCIGFLAGSSSGSLRGLPAILSNYSLCALLLVIGYDIGKNRIWLLFRECGAISLTLPLFVGLSSLAAAVLASMVFGLSPALGLSAGSGFGWYSMAGALALKQAGAEIGAYVFLTNLLREILTIMIVPVLAGRVPTQVGAAMGGATSMDSTLPVITRAFGYEGAMWGLITGTTLSLLAPFVLGVFLRLLPVP